MDWTDAYANTIHIHDGQMFPDRWADAAQKFRAANPSETDGLTRLFPGQSRGLFVFIHGGYWHETTPDLWSHLAGGALALGAAALFPAYRLAPAARISAMPGDVARAISWAAARVPGPIVLTGHSAGGYLAARLICDDSPLPPDIRARIRLCLAISGLYDLRPITRCQMNDTLALDAAEARAESPAFYREPQTPFTAWVGADERPEFVRQSKLIAARWPMTRLVVEPGRHHYDVIAGLSHPDSAIMAPVKAAGGWSARPVFP